MNEEDFKRRTKQLAVRAIELVQGLPRTGAADVIGRQLIRSATSVGANYRAACRALSTADMIAKLGHVEEEADESLYWMELLIEAGAVSKDRIRDLLRETDEVVAMVVASIKTLRSRNPKPKMDNPK